MTRAKIVCVIWKVHVVKHFECLHARPYFRRKSRRAERKRYDEINLTVQRFFLLTKIVYLPFPQTTAKNKQRRRNVSPTKRNKLLTRSVMDLPTTDPGSDFPDYYTTEDECETDYDTEGNATKSTSRKMLRGDMRKANSASCEAMPPELIITKVLYRGCS